MGIEWIINFQVKIYMYLLRLIILLCFSALFVLQLSPCYADIGLDSIYLSDLSSEASLKSHQGWGLLGVNSAAGAPGGTRFSPMRIGETVYDKGMGHHANGVITVPLHGEYLCFEAIIGLQWQGGGKGSVVFQVFVDGGKAFESEVMSDSDAAAPVRVSLSGAQELRLVANDNKDGIACDMANWAEARLTRDPRQPHFDPTSIILNGEAAPSPSLPVGGFSLIAGINGPQVAVMEPENALLACVGNDETIDVVIPIRNAQESITVTAEAMLDYGESASVSLHIGDKVVCKKILKDEVLKLEVSSETKSDVQHLALRTTASRGDSSVRWRNLQYNIKGKRIDIPFKFPITEEALPLPELSYLHPAVEQALIEWDWKMQDGIGTDRNPGSWVEAIEQIVQRGDLLIDDLNDKEISLESLTTEWKQLRSEWRQMMASNNNDENRWENLWKRMHKVRRQIVFSNPLADMGPLLFVKQAPGNSSHQLTQYYGAHSRPGGGIFALDRPGESMRCQPLTATNLPMGSVQFADISYDGKKILFSYCPVDKDYKSRPRIFNRYYHIYEMNADGSGLRQLTDGDYDDFAPRYLPDGKLIFISTRRGGFHRCGRGPCPVYTLCNAEEDGSDIRVISFHETHEWDPSVLNDGRVIYTRWDYVDRHAVHYQQLWTVRPDGSDVRIYYGNNTLNPIGIWEAKSIPGSDKVIATAAAHHAMTAGSIILLDVNHGIDGLNPITRLTPDALFPESETPVIQWSAPVGVKNKPVTPPEAQRWPGHCYRTPHPLSEKYFLAAYSYDALIGEPNMNHANMFGLYFMDAYGNKELLYRDLNIASLWPVPLRPRKRPFVIPSIAADTDEKEGTFSIQNVYESWPSLPDSVKIKQIRVSQVLPKSTPHINDPMVGLANASPGKQVLGTVPVEADGSAYFRAPSGIPLSFQALDERGMAVQVMRSLIYLQPGETRACIGCHEPYSKSPDLQRMPKALARKPSIIQAGPDGSNPFSYPILVQPVLDKHCIQCHSQNKSGERILLSGNPAKNYTESYLSLAPRVPYSAWGGGNFQKTNSEPMSQPDYFGARGSKLMSMLLAGHHKVNLSQNDIERLATWMDTNALFYGTFNPTDQKRQQQGQRIAGPGLE